MDKFRVGPVVKDNKPGVHGVLAAAIFHVDGIGVAADVVRGFEDRDLVVPGQMISGHIAGDAGADHRDLHRRASAGVMPSAISRAVLIRGGTGRTSQISPSAFSRRRKYQVRSTSHQKNP